MIEQTQIIVIIPTYRAKTSILHVLEKMGPEVDRVFVVDDACPEKTGAWVLDHNRDQRVEVLTHTQNQGVGGAVLTGYQKILQNPQYENAILIKLDADGQMDPALIPGLVRPIIRGHADYTKGNRFFGIDYLSSMPSVRVFGNAVLSFVNKASSGYWSIMDPTNGFTAIHLKTLRYLPLQRISHRYFFESDMLFRLGLIRACVKDVPMQAVYADEVSNMQISKIILEFPLRYLISFCKRIFYRYFLRDFGIGSLQLLAAIPLITFGIGYGAIRWVHAIETLELTPTGEIFLAALPVIVGIQFLLSAIAYDILNEPKDAVHVLV